MRDILSRETAASVNHKTITLPETSSYARIADRYPGTLIQRSEDASVFLMTLEGNLHHSEGEIVTHLFNVQRLKRAQGLEASVDLPPIGYWTLPDWDRSEA